MNILLINDYFDGGGAEIVFREQYEILRKDFHVELFYAFRSLSETKRTPGSYIYSRHFKQGLTDFLRNRKFDCVIIHNYNSALSPSVLDALAQYKKRENCKIIYYAHDYHLVAPNRGYHYFSQGKMINFQSPPTFAEILNKQMDAKGLIYSWLKKIQWINAYTIGRKQNVFDLILAPSDFLVAQIKALYPKMNIHRMYNVCNSLNICRPEANKERTGTIRLVFFGRFDPVKGLVEFIEAIRHSSVDYTFTMIGEGEESERIRAIIKKYNLQTKISIKDKLNQTGLFAELQHYDVFVLPALWYENAPLSIVEAAALNLGLFLSHHGGVLEMGKICNASHFFNPFDSKDIVNQLDKLYNDFAAGILPMADREHLQKLFSRETYIENLKKYINDGR